MENNINEFLELIKKFNKTPRNERQKTFLEICKYPYSRFEEICSRILQFYFNPNATHGLGDLWIKSLFQALNMVYTGVDYDSTTVDTEENTDGKRIDITINTNGCVIGIENKITAEVYNPLDIYNECFKKRYHDKKIIMVVLSLRRQTDIDIVKKIKNNEFTNITYNDLFQQVKLNMGEYIIYNNSPYTTYMLDFIKTIEHMENNNSSIENDFFFENKESIDNLISRYQVFRENILNEHRNEISILKQRISDITNAEWWAWQGWDLGISFNNDKGNRIGIESNFEATKENAFKMFHIYITTWNKKDWEPYKDEVLKEFPESIKLDEQSVPNRIYLHLPIIYDNNHEEIIRVLKETYKKMKNITSKQH